MVLPGIRPMRPKLPLKAGSDMDMEGGSYEEGLASLVKDGKVDESLIDDSVKRVLRVKFKLGLFEDPYRYANKDLLNSITYKKHMEVARDIARKSIVLLKNENNIIAPWSTVKNIAVIGPSGR
jgi:beta-glucosidase